MATTQGTSTAGPVRVLYVLPTLRVGGAERQAILTACGLDRSKFEPFVAALSLGGPLEDVLMREGIPHCVVGPLKRGTGWFEAVRRHPRGLARLARLVRSQRPDVLHAYLPVANIYCAILRILSVTRARLIVGKRSLGLYKHTRGVLAHLEAWASRVADRVHVNSDAVGEAVIAQERVDRRKVVRLYNGVDTDHFVSETPEEHAGPVLCVVAHLRPCKGHGVLLRALPRILDEYPELSLRLVGDDRGMRSELEHLSSELGVGEHVEFVGHLPDPRPAVGASDVVVQASLEEGFPNAVLEAMAMAKPIVATRVGGTAEAIEDGVSGLLVEAGSPEALAEAILKVLGDDSLRSSLACAARQRVEEAFTLDGVTEGLARLYEELLEPKSRDDGNAEVRLR